MLTRYSDSCYGQNKNAQMISFWSYLIAQNRFTRIDHKYLVRGHTYLLNDRDFSRIEKRKASARVHLPEDWENVVCEACPSKPFEVVKMTREKFSNIADLTKHFTLQKKDSNGSPVLLSRANWLNFGEGEENGEVVSHPQEYWMRSSFNTQEPWQKVCILKGRCKLLPPSDIPFSKLYPDGHPINPKIADLQLMIPYLPCSARAFYASLKDHPICDTRSADDVVD